MANEEFNLQDWLNASLSSKEEVYSTPEEVKEKLKALGTEMRDICAEHGVPLFLAYAHGADSGACNISNTHQFLPLHRVPLEMLLSLIAVRNGAESAVGIGSELLMLREE